MRSLLHRIFDHPIPGWFVWYEPPITGTLTYWMWRHRLAGWFVCPRTGHVWMGGPAWQDECYRCRAGRTEV